MSEHDVVEDGGIKDPMVRAAIAAVEYFMGPIPAEDPDTIKRKRIEADLNSSNTGRPYHFD